MKFAATLNEAQHQVLQQVRKSSACHRERERAHAVLLSAKGYTLDQLADIFEADRDTISRWLDEWQSNGVEGLSDALKSGRPAKLDKAAHELVEQAVQSPTPNLKAVLQAQLKKGSIR